MIILLAGLVLVLCAAIYKLQTGARLRRAVQRRLAPYVCRVRPHRRSLQTVRLEGDVYRSRCKRCGAAIERLGKDGEWQAIAAPEPVVIERRSRRREPAPDQPPASATDLTDAREPIGETGPLSAS